MQHDHVIWGWVIVVETETGRMAGVPLQTAHPIRNRSELRKEGLSGLETAPRPMKGSPDLASHAVSAQPAKNN